MRGTVKYSVLILEKYKPYEIYCAAATPRAAETIHSTDMFTVKKRKTIAALSMTKQSASIPINLELINFVSDGLRHESSIMIKNIYEYPKGLYNSHAELLILDII